MACFEYEKVGDGRDKTDRSASVWPGNAIATVEAAKQINGLVAIAGVEVLDRRSDFQGVQRVPGSLDGVDKWPNPTLPLLEEGYPAAEVRICAENMLRLGAQAEQEAKSVVPARDRP